jgi:phosphopantetheinyl transferase (holo-ACP synthase)
MSGGDGSTAPTASTDLGRPAGPARDDRARHRHHQGRPHPRRRSPGSATASRTASSRPHEQRHVRGRPETMAGRWAAKEAVSKVLGPGRAGDRLADIEIERLPTGQPSVVLHGRAAARAEQLGHGPGRGLDQPRADYAVAVAFGVRTTGGRYVFPPDIEAARRARAPDPVRADRAAARTGARGGGGRSGRSRSRRRGRRWRPGRRGEHRRPSPWIASSTTTTSRPALLPERDRRAATRARSASCSWSRARSTTPARRCSCALPRAGRGRPGHAGRPRIAPAALRRQGRRGDHDGARRGRRRGGRAGARPRPDPRPRARRARRRARAAAGPRDRGRARPRPPRVDGGGRRRLPAVVDAEALRSLAAEDGWWEGVAGRAS